MYDIIIIGAGTAGISADKEAIKYTSNLLIINKGSWDTTCVRVGCMPRKVLISTANRMHDIQHADEVALNVQSEINTDQVMHHVQNLRDRFARATLTDVESWEEKHKIDGEAKFINANTVDVNGQHYP
ncbi:FAD-dependent oxidoreductase, partial [Acinetobacter nematophilus]|uniref:FAD-dependent oxidoreductase n=1 Tax=Acinetobacter nematophilus TaxID=2994642 RepID=UPI003AF9DBC0